MMITDSHGAHVVKRLTRTLKNTKLCVFWSHNSCKKMNDCPFAHNASELRQKPNLEKTKFCNYSQGASKCPKGSRCTFAHSHHELVILSEPLLSEDVEALVVYGATCSDPPPPVHYVELLRCIEMCSSKTDPIDRLAIRDCLISSSPEKYEE
jgi:hypothetical protein